MPYGGRRRRAEWDHGGQWQWRQAGDGRPSQDAFAHTIYFASCYTVVDPTLLRFNGPEMLSVLNCQVPGLFYPQCQATLELPAKLRRASRRGPPSPLPQCRRGALQPCLRSARGVRNHDRIHREATSSRLLRDEYNDAELYPDDAHMRWSRLGPRLLCRTTGSSSVTFGRQQ